MSFFLQITVVEREKKLLSWLVMDLSMVAQFTKSKANCKLVQNHKIAAIVWMMRELRFMAYMTNLLDIHTFCYIWMML